ncbi:hypothetical protein AYI70_g17 [Smittium culicis]|uniref:Uncharacterized protein n=1 Tax=Smittium culicis TaxID=133412 RepID=A0A1R1YI56_9FUNG|nr:hypothetical protein AYI70_g17 [Smittium culicis]
MTSEKSITAISSSIIKSKGSNDISKKDGNHSLKDKFHPLPKIDSHLKAMESGNKAIPLRSSREIINYHDVSTSANIISSQTEIQARNDKNIVLKSKHSKNFEKSPDISNRSPTLSASPNYPNSSGSFPQYKSDPFQNNNNPAQDNNKVLPKNLSDSNHNVSSINNPKNHLDVLAYVTMNSPSINKTSAPNRLMTPIKPQIVHDTTPSRIKRKHDNISIRPVAMTEPKNKSFSSQKIIHNFSTTPVPTRKSNSFRNKAGTLDSNSLNHNSDLTQSEDEESWQRRSTKARRLATQNSATRSPLKSNQFSNNEKISYSQDHPNSANFNKNLLSPTIIAKPPNYMNGITSPKYSQIYPAHPGRIINEQEIPHAFRSDLAPSPRKIRQKEILSDNLSQIYCPLNSSARQTQPTSGNSEIFSRFYQSKTPLRFKQSSMPNNKNISSTVYIDRTFQKTNSFNTPTRIPSHTKADIGIHRDNKLPPIISPSYDRNKNSDNDHTTKKNIHNPFLNAPDRAPANKSISPNPLSKPKFLANDKIESHYTNSSQKIPASGKKRSMSNANDRVDGDTTETDEECVNLPPFSPIPLNKKRNSVAFSSTQRILRYPMSENISRKANSANSEFNRAYIESPAARLSSRSNNQPAISNNFQSPYDNIPINKSILHSPTPMPHFSKTAQFSTPQHSKNVVKMKSRQPSRPIATNFSSDEDRARVKNYINPPLHNLRKSSSGKFENRNYNVKPSNNFTESDSHLNSNTSRIHTRVLNGSEDTSSALDPSRYSNQPKVHEIYNEPQYYKYPDHSVNSNNDTFLSNRKSGKKYNTSVLTRSNSGDTTETDDELVTIVKGSSENTPLSKYTQPFQNVIKEVSNPIIIDRFKHTVTENVYSRSSRNNQDDQIEIKTRSSNNTPIKSQKIGFKPYQPMPTNKFGHYVKGNRTKTPGESSNKSSITKNQLKLKEETLDSNNKDAKNLQKQDNSSGESTENHSPTRNNSSHESESATNNSRNPEKAIPDSPSTDKKPYINIDEPNFASNSPSDSSKFNNSLPDNPDNYMNKKDLTSGVPSIAKINTDYIKDDIINPDLDKANNSAIPFVDKNVEPIHISPEYKNPSKVQNQYQTSSNCTKSSNNSPGLKNNQPNTTNNPVNKERSLDHELPKPETDCNNSQSQTQNIQQKTCGDLVGDNNKDKNNLDKLVDYSSDTDSEEYIISATKTNDSFEQNTDPSNKNLNFDDLSNDSNISGLIPDERNLNIHTFDKSCSSKPGVGTSHNIPNSNLAASSSKLVKKEVTSEQFFESKNNPFC